VGGIFITGDDLPDLFTVVRSFHVEAVTRDDEASGEQGMGGFWMGPLWVEPSRGNVLAFVGAGRAGGLSLLAAALADRLERSPVGGASKKEWLSDFFRGHPRNRHTRRACARTVAELRARGHWPWSRTAYGSA
jgi:hypothetical protein